MLLPRSALYVRLILFAYIPEFMEYSSGICAHENQEKALHHFGHHAALSYEASQHSHTEKTEVEGTMHKAPLSLSDHHDHLPSCFHVVIVEAQEKNCFTFNTVI